MGTKKRCDGNLIKGLPSFRIINPFVMRGRTESSIYFSHKIRIGRTLEFIRRFNHEHIGKGLRLSLFHVILCGLVRIIALRPQLNRFIAGQRIYQRNRIQLSFIVKKQLTEAGKETNAKISFSPYETLETIIGKVNAEVVKARDETGNESDREIDFFTKLPRFLLNLVIKAFKALDYFGIAPKTMIELDPLYTSVYVANLGSVGMDAPFHHLYEWGTASIFVAIGRVAKEPVAGENETVETCDILTLNYTMDDRISEGFYCARGLEMFKNIIENPEVLLERPDLTPELLGELNLSEKVPGN
jgi:hypothetical protein